MGHHTIYGVLLGLLLVNANGWAAPFENLDFEQADVSGLSVPAAPLTPSQVAAVFPHWTLSPAYPAFDTVALGSTSISLHDSASFLTAVLGQEPLPLQGNYSLVLQTEAPIDPRLPPADAFISQVGTVPSNATAVQVLVPNTINGFPPPSSSTGSFYQVTDLQLFLDGIDIPLVPLLVDVTNNLIVLTGDVTSFAGTERELKFELFNPFGLSDNIAMIDAIAFVPEPSTAFLLFVGLSCAGGHALRRNFFRPRSK